MLFARLGGLSPVKYKYKEGFQFHAPRRKGIWAFPFPYIEMFLCMWDDTHKKELETKRFRYFNYDGPIWHHLGEGTESWKKSVMDEYQYLLKATKHKDIKWLNKMERNDFKIKPSISSDPYKRGRGGCISKDHLEVFIEKSDLGKIR